MGTEYDMSMPKAPLILRRVLFMLFLSFLSVPVIDEVIGFRAEAYSRSGMVPEGCVPSSFTGAMVLRMS